MQTITLTEENFDKEVKQSAQPVLVSFRCNGELSVPNYKCCKVDDKKSTRLTDRYAVGSMPTIVLFRGGKVTDTIVGSMRTEQLMRILQ